MKVTADFLIDRRKRQWEVHHDIRKDEKFVRAVAYEITQNKLLREEVIEYPEKLIELCFTVVDKNKKIVPFFINDVQHEFIDTLNKAIDDYIALNNYEFSSTTPCYQIQKCDLGQNENCPNVSVCKVTKNNNTITFSDIINAGILNESEFINPRYSSACSKTNQIEIYKDVDSVFYYRYNLDCITEADNKTDGWVYNNATFIS